VFRRATISCEPITHQAKLQVTIGYALENLLLAHHGDDGVGESRKVHRSNIVVNTKVGRYEADPRIQFDFTYDATINSVQRSLRRCSCHYFDVIQLHDPGMSVKSESSQCVFV